VSNECTERVSSERFAVRFSDSRFVISATFLTFILKVPGSNVDRITSCSG
jgi:hypothetical protein